MSKQIEIFIDKLYRYDRISEPCFIGFPLAKGLLNDADSFRLYDPVKKSLMPTQIKVTSRYDDGSVRFIFIRFLADIPANQKCSYICEIDTTDDKTSASCDHANSNSTDSDASCMRHELPPFNTVCVKETPAGFEISTIDDTTGSDFVYTIKNNSEEIFDSLKAQKISYSKDQFAGPVLTKAGAPGDYAIKTGKWQIVESGPICAILKTKGIHTNETTGENISFELKLTAWAGKSYTEVSYRIINDTDEPLEIKSLEYRFLRPQTQTALSDNIENSIFHVTNSAEADQLAESTDLGEARTIVASSNYKTDYLIGKDGGTVKRVIDTDWLMQEANEHFSETFYGTFFADYTDNEVGICATIFQAQQNYPKAIEAGNNGITLYLVPEAIEKVVLQSGMSREQRFLLHFHETSQTIGNLNDRSIVYQMPCRPYVLPEVHKESGVWPNIFVQKADYIVEQCLIVRADTHSRAYGMLNFGDSYDSAYTTQGRGGNRLVWCNNEYDYPHACALLFVRTGTRRFLDYNIASASHWMDVDICHYHKDPLYIGGQWEHTAGHVINGVMVCSHEWVEGLLDYYHLTGDERGLESALGIGENVLKLLDLPMYANAGESNARETGWALRTLTALYIETNDKKWLSKCEKILDDFRIWEKQYGHWLAPYTDNTMVRVPFMISIAIGSLMRYYVQFPDDELKGLILRAVDDMIENCYEKNCGVFYYKELPSLTRLGNNTLILEALTIAYDLTGDTRYLGYGIETFKKTIANIPSYSSSKRKDENSVIVGTASSKNFAQCMIPIAGFYRAIVDAGINYQ